jgi:serine phosphatase RsbU (regulator of sigma subunit)
MQTELLAAIFFFAALISIVYIFLLSKKKHILKESIHILEKNINEYKFRIEKLEASLRDSSPIQEQIDESEKQKLAEKNRKLWTMSEAVYKEKKKVDEELQKLAQEKIKLEEAKAKLDDKVKKLWATSTAVHKEKERINTLKQEIEQKHQEIVDSVNYAQRIQEAILPNRRDIDLHIPDNFILFRPRDIVSGDFYWFSAKGDEKILACVDCTGHGVPGAFMSMIGNTLLNQIVNERDITRPDMILNELNKEIVRVLKQDDEGSDSRDGMDIAVININYLHRSLQYAGANRPLYIVSQNVLTEIKADKKAIGGFHFDNTDPYTNHIISFTEGMTIYLSTDGFADQFNPDDKKYMTKRFREFLCTEPATMQEQHQRLEQSFLDWKKHAEQTDDVLVMGVKLQVSN